ncbi:exonuclease 1 [Achlya hypogyna]|uniref:Exonuclease 1 n=1 Tax=Achlya hypogyna TaxID=1202772 RepID=A0A1V9YXU5_ACHHY|nr:exonuclease 1 [Achlya hypogyna]
MGIQDLLPKLKTVLGLAHVSKYRGKRAAIDAYGWLYKGAYSCVVELGLGSIDSHPPGVYVEGAPTEPYIAYCLSRLELLLDLDITPIFVFDGAPLPAKETTNHKRKADRDVYLEKAREFHAEGNTKKSFPAFCRALTVTRAMARKLLVTLAARYPKVQCIVAPYEADAQLAFLSKERIVDLVLSEDSDCIPYGCKTVFFKLGNDGYGEEFRRRYLGANDELSFVGWSEEMFLQFCVLSGSDYCPTLKQIGPAAAHHLVVKHQSPEKILDALSTHKEYSPAFRTSYLRALLTFRHHLVFDPRRQKCQMLNPLDLSKDVLKLYDGTLDFLGKVDLPDDVAVGIANGLLNPKTHEPEAWALSARQAPSTQSKRLAPAPESPRKRARIDGA